MNKKTAINENEPNIRKQYNQPLLFEYGDLNKLTHGSSGDYTDPVGGQAYAYPVG